MAGELVLHFSCRCDCKLLLSITFDALRNWHSRGSILLPMVTGREGWRKMRSDNGF
jgi:hypothetical protein